MVAQRCVGVLLGGEGKEQTIKDRVYMLSRRLAPERVRVVRLCTA